MSDFSKICLILDNIPGYDGNENFGEYPAKDADIMTVMLSPEIRSAAIAAGAREPMLNQLTLTTLPLLERWVKFQPFWERIRNCAPAALYDIAVKIVTGNEFGTFTIMDINQRFNDVSCQVDALRLAGLKKCVISVDNLDGGVCDDVFSNVYNIENFICPECAHVRKSLEQLAGLEIKNMDDWLQATELAVNKLMVNGITVFRISVPVKNIDCPSVDEAKEAFNKLSDGNFEGKEIFCRFMIRHVMRLCQRLCLGVQMLNIAIPDYAEARAFFTEYNKVRFDIMTDRFLFHVKHLPNVYWNMGRLCALKPCHAERLLSESLLEIPVNKISVFGGGFYHPWLAAGAAVSTRRLVVNVLYNAMRRGEVNEKRVEYIARQWLYENAAALYERNAG